MLKFFKRLVGIQHAPPPQPKRRSKKGRNQQDYSTEPASLPEVVEGNTHSDWQLWQDSVNSQLTPLTRPSNSQFASSPSSEYDELDPYSRVHKNRDA